MMMTFEKSRFLIKFVLKAYHDDKKRVEESKHCLIKSLPETLGVSRKGNTSKQFIVLKALCTMIAMKIHFGSLSIS